MYASCNALKTPNVSPKKLFRFDIQLQQHFHLDPEIVGLFDSFLLPRI